MYTVNKIIRKNWKQKIKSAFLLKLESLPKKRNFCLPYNAQISNKIRAARKENGETVCLHDFRVVFHS